MVMMRLQCGIIHSQDFADYLRQKFDDEKVDHFGKILSLDYVRMSEGANAGNSWWQLSWISEFSAPVNQRHTVGGVEVFIHRQSRNGLKNRLLHYANGQVVVKK